LDEPAYSTADLRVAVGSLSLLDFFSRDLPAPALVEWTICEAVRGLVVAYLVYRAAREALGRTDLPVFVDAWEGFPGGAYQRVIESVGDGGLLRRLAPGEENSASAVCVAAQCVLRATYLRVLKW
jgi:hypothetical protein